jgi:hypothetical protein
MLGYEISTTVDPPIETNCRQTGKTSCPPHQLVPSKIWLQKIVGQAFLTSQEFEFGIAPHVYEETCMR